MPIVFVFILSVIYLEAQTISQIVDKSLVNHPSLKSIEFRISAMDERIQKSQNLDNPDLSLTLNDIQFDDPLDRSLEPMQYSAIKVKQKFPWFGKRDAKKQVEIEKKTLLFHSLEVAQVSLAQRVRIDAYKLLEIQERIQILQKYITLLQQAVKLHNNYNSTESNHHSAIMATEFKLSTTKIKLERYKAIEVEQKARLEYLIQSNFKNITLKDNITKPMSLQRYLNKLEQNPNYHSALSKIKIAKANVQIKELNRYADPYLQVGYFNRQDYPDYASVSVGLSLSIYGSESLDVQASHKELLATKSQLDDYRNSLKRDIKMVYAKLQESYHIYRIIADESLPQIAHLFELNSASVESGGDLLIYIRLLSEKLQSEEQLIIAKTHYRQNSARLHALIGEK